MANRTTYSGSSTPPLTGVDFLNEYSQRNKQLFDNSAIKLTAVAGTVNAVTASLDPLLDGGGLVDGMKFTVTWGATNTGGMTLAINGGAGIAVVDAQGAALIASAVVSGLRSLIEYIGGQFRHLTPILATAGSGSLRYYWNFTASGTWIKPTGPSADTMVTVEMWAAGGGGGNSNGGGGGGGAYITRYFRLGDLASSVAVTVGAGGAAGSPGANGGNSSFGSLLTAFGGAGGASSSNPGGGGGGTQNAGSGLTGGFQGGGNGGGSGAVGLDATNPNGGGGGSGGGGLGFAGARGVYGGGGGGGGLGAGPGGDSLFGGAGGARGSAGVAPGGGGGGSGGTGGRGEIRIYL